MKIYKIISRETGQIFAYAASRLKAEEIQKEIHIKEFNTWQNTTFPDIKKKMETSLNNMCRGNAVSFNGEIVDPYNTLESFLENRLNGNHYNDDGELCNCQNSVVCDCYYKTRDSIDILEVEAKE